MITAVDTNILLDFLNPNEPHHETSTQLLLSAGSLGPLVVCEAAFAELAANLGSEAEVQRFLAVAGLTAFRSSGHALASAGQAWLQYARRPPGTECPSCGTSHDLSCSNCGRSLSPRQHVLADFLIGAHALVHADQLLTRDRGYYRTYFPELRLA